MIIIYNSPPPSLSPNYDWIVIQIYLGWRVSARVRDWECIVLFSAHELLGIAIIRSNFGCDLAVIRLEPSHDQTVIQSELDRDPTWTRLRSGPNPTAIPPESKSNRIATRFWLRSGQNLTVIRLEFESGPITIRFWPDHDRNPTWSRLPMTRCHCSDLDKFWPQSDQILAAIQSDSDSNRIAVGF